MSNITSSFSFVPVHPDAVEKVIDKLKNSSSFGLDGIDTSVIKLMKPYVLPAITHVINLSLETNTFTDDWKKPKLFHSSKKVVRWTLRTTDQ